MIEWMPVASKAVDRVAYDDDALLVQFPAPAGSPARIFRFAPVSRNFFDQLFADGASVGSLIHGLRRDKGITCVRVPDVIQPARLAQE